MPQFTTTIDGHAYTWSLVIHLGHVAAIQAVYPEFRLEKILSEDQTCYKMLCDDAGLLCLVLETLIEKQLQSRGVTFVQFLESFHGEATDAAILALVQAVATFSPSRTAKQQAVRIEAILQAVRQADQDLACAMSSGISSGPVPPGPESSPGGTASGS